MSENDKYKDNTCNMDDKNTNEEKEEIKLAKKNNRIGIIAVVVTIIVFITGVFTTAFNKEIHDKAIKIFQQLFSQSTVKNEEDKKDEKNPTSETTTAGDDTDLPTMENTTILDSFGGQIVASDKFNSISFLGVDTLNVFCSDKVYQKKVFYNDFEKWFRDSESDDNTEILCELKGYGIYCEVENLYPYDDNSSYYTVLCDSNKNPISQEDSQTLFGLNSFYGILYGNEKRIFAFSLKKPLVQGKYYCAFFVSDYTSGYHDEVFIEFQIE